MQLYLALSAVLASGGQQPLTALQEADAELASLTPDTAKTKVAFPPARWSARLGMCPGCPCWPGAASALEQAAITASVLLPPTRSPSRTRCSQSLCRLSWLCWCCLQGAIMGRLGRSASSSRVRASGASGSSSSATVPQSQAFTGDADVVAKRYFFALWSGKEAIQETGLLSATRESILCGRSAVCFASGCVQHMVKSTHATPDLSQKCAVPVHCRLCWNKR